MAKAVTEVAIGAAAIAAAIFIPGGGIAIAGLAISHLAAVSALTSIAMSSVMAGVSDALKGSQQGGLAVGVTTPVGPWSYVYGTQKVGGVEIFRESNSNTGASGSTSNNKQLHRVYALAAHPCALGNWQLRIDGKQVLMTASGSDWVSYSPTQTTRNVTSISRSNGVVTMQLDGAMPAGTDGQTLKITNVSNNYFNGTYVVTQVTPGDFTKWSYVCGGSDMSTSGGKVSTTYSDYKDKIRVSFLNGNHKSTFSTLLAAGTSWKGSDLCLGRTLAYVQMGYDEGVFPSSIPNVSFVIDGKNDIYDPRTSSRGFTDNPALIIADCLSLPPSQGGFGLVIGTDIPTANLIAAANKCDELVNLSAGGTTKRYTCDTFIQLNQSRGTILQQLLTSCAGRISYQGGQYSIFPGAWVAPTLSLTDADLMGAIDWRPRFSVRDTCNGVKGTYISPENAYQQADFPAYMCDALHGYASDAYLAEDGGERIFKEANFPCTDTAAVAQRLAKIALMRTRWQGRGTIRCSMKAYQAVALDVIQLTHPHYGWTNKNFEVLASRFGVNTDGDHPTPYVELDIAETDSSIYDWTPTEQLTPQGYLQPNNVGSRICLPPENVIAYSGTGGLLNGYNCPSTVTTRADGTVDNALYIAWTQPNDAHVVHGGHMEVQYQATSASSWTSLGKIDPSAGNAIIASVSDGASYNVQVRAVNSAGVASDWIQATPYPVTASNTGKSLPANVSNVTATEGPVTTDNGVVSGVSVSFTPGVGFNTAEVYFTGYNGSGTPVLMASGTTSPINFLCATTDESVMVSVVAVDKYGARSDLASVPTVWLALDGVISAPLAPRIKTAQSALDDGKGWQFEFLVNSGLLTDQIAGYRIYHSENPSDTAPAYYTTKTQPPTNVGSIIVQEVTGDLLWYWVSAISTSGLESTLVAVPFQYVDPGSPPPSLTAVTTTQTYAPKSVALNGWAANAHVGYFETQDLTSGSNNFGLGSQVVGAYTSPASAYDGNQSTAANYTGTHHAGYSGVVWTFNGNTLPAGATVTGATLSVVSDVQGTAGICGEASVYYSTDGGTNWTPLYVWDAHNTG
jgi:hypothetical protein